MCKIQIVYLPIIYPLFGHFEHQAFTIDLVASMEIVSRSYSGADMHQFIMSVTMQDRWYICPYHIHVLAITNTKPLQLI